MSRGSSARVVACLGLLAVFVYISSAALAVPDTTADRNLDGRSDIWTYYDAAGQLIRVETDTNFDGRQDVEESYAGGRLVRRASDRDFDGRVDLLDEYDPDNGQTVRAAADADFDGSADLLVLFTDGEPAYSEWLAPPAPDRARWPVARATSRTGGDDGRLRVLDDPFRSQSRLAAPFQDRDRPAGDSEAPGVLVVPRTIVSFSTTTRIEAPRNPADASAPLLVGPTRSPPSRQSQVESRKS